MLPHGILACAGSGTHMPVEKRQAWPGKHQGECTAAGLPLQKGSCSHALAGASLAGCVSGLLRSLGHVQLLAATSRLSFVGIGAAYGEAAGMLQWSLLDAVPREANRFMQLLASYQAPSITGGLSVALVRRAAAWWRGIGVRDRLCSLPAQERVLSLFACLMCPLVVVYPSPCSQMAAS